MVEFMGVGWFGWIIFFGIFGFWVFSGRDIFQFERR
jgi:hypothetical protein